MNAEEIARSVETLYPDRLAEGATIQSVDFLAWPFWCLDLEIRFSLRDEPNVLEGAILGMREGGLSQDEVMLATGLDGATIASAIEDRAGKGMRRLGTFFVDRVLFDGVAGRFVCGSEGSKRRLREIRQVSLPPGQPRVMWPVVRPPLATDIPGDTVRQLLEDRAELDEVINAPENDLLEVVGVYENLRSRMLYALVCVVLMSSSTGREWLAFDVLSKTDFRLDDDDWNTLRKHAMLR